MRVLGIDPGVAQTGWAVLETGAHPSQATLIASGLLKTLPEHTLPHRLTQLHGGLAAILTDYRPQMLAIEELFFTKIARSVAATSHARGVLMLAAAQHGVPIAEYNPRTVKTSLTGNGNSLKPQMQKMVKVLLALKEIPRPDDVADAMAIGLCHLKHVRFQSRMAPPPRQTSGGTPPAGQGAS